jgi:hypothetical protein
VRGAAVTVRIGEAEQDHLLRGSSRLDEQLIHGIKTLAAAEFVQQNALLLPITLVGAKSIRIID